MLRIYRYPERYAIVSLPADGPAPAPPPAGYYTCIRDKNEWTLVVPEGYVPADAAQVAGGYRVVMLDTAFAFDVVGVLAQCSQALAAAGIPIMAYSSYLTDIFLFQDRHADAACAILEGLSFDGD